MTHITIPSTEGHFRTLQAYRTFKDRMLGVAIVLSKAELGGPDS